MSEADRVILKELEKFIKTFDDRVDSKIDSKLLKNHGVKWQIFTAVISTLIAVTAIHVGVFASVNKDLIQKSIAVSMSEYNKQLESNSKQLESINSKMKILFTGYFKNTLKGQRNTKAIQDLEKFIESEN